ncbi:MAG: hypothetical protein H6567_06195 [Lewinellaceae bacterium]|nr:hypothetical protein [Lewinellaceae bacterium]
MIGKLKRWIFNREFHSDIKKDLPHRVIVNPVKNIGIIYNLNIDNQDLTYINKFIDKIIDSGKKVVTLSFQNTKRTNQENQNPTYYSSDITWYGVPKHNDITSFTDQDLDLLILLPNTYAPHFEYIIRKSNAKFKVGFSSAKVGKFLNLIIESYNEDPISQRIHKLIKILTSISQ